MVSQYGSDSSESVVTALLATSVAFVLLFAVVVATFGGLLEAAVSSAAPMNTRELRGLVPSEGSSVYHAGGGSDVVALARSRLGLPYIWGATGPDSFDCSGLVVWVYRRLGLDIPRTAQQQFSWATPISPAAMQRADLVFYAHTYATSPSEPITHVGIYAGGGVVVMATTSGDFVRTVSLDDPYWRAHFAGAGRVPTLVTDGM